MDVNLLLDYVNFIILVFFDKKLKTHKLKFYGIIFVFECMVMSDRVEKMKQMPKIVSISSTGIQRGIEIRVPKTCV